MITDADSFAEWQEVREQLLRTYCERVLPRDLQVATEPWVDLRTCMEVMARTVHTALLIDTGADPAAQTKMLVLIRDAYRLMQREWPAPEFEKISSKLFGAWWRVLAEEERMN